mmetsp:Transcript_32/g.96  ORF Transcript_32/g.96 Transcript_32/m.96 type:complete len:546 (+) Transcript_32:51-1688(+)
MAPCGGLAEDHATTGLEKLRTIKADVRKASRQSSLGIDIVLYTSYGQRHGIIIERIRNDGDIPAWNKRCLAEMDRLRSGDFIICVNGIKDDPSAMARELWAAIDLQITVQRSASNANNLARTIIDPLAMQWQQDVDRTEVQWRIVEAPEWAVGSLAFQAILSRQGGRRLGIDVLTSEAYGRLGLVVNEVFGSGVVASWNELCPRDLRVMPGDCVIDVNGKTEPNAMLEEMRVKSDLVITFLRPSEPVPRPSATASTSWNSSDRGCAARAAADGDRPPDGLLQGSPLTFEVRLDRAAYSRLGITVLLVAGPTGGVVVTGVAQQGAVGEWNQRRKKSHQVAVGDYIIDVNGINAQNATLERMAREFSTAAAQVSFTVERRKTHSAEVTELLETALRQDSETQGNSGIPGPPPAPAGLPRPQGLETDVGVHRRTQQAWSQPPQGIQPPPWGQQQLVQGHNLREAQQSLAGANPAELPPWRTPIGEHPAAPPMPLSEDPSLMQMLGNEDFHSILAQALEQRGWLRANQGTLPQECPARGFPGPQGRLGM